MRVWAYFYFPYSYLCANSLSFYSVCVWNCVRVFVLACVCHPQIRNKLNQDQNSKLQQQKDLLNKRNMEVTLMDKRIGELRERLYKKKAEARQKENLPVRLGTDNAQTHWH